MTLRVFPLIVFVLVVTSVVACVIKERKVRIPKLNWSFTLDYSLPPLIGVLLLLISQSLSIKQVWKGGVVGDDKIQPFSIIILFNALAYLCISVDLTGVLAYIALKVAKSAGSSARRLFLYFYLLSSIFTIITSNDIVILTLTPIIFYCCNATQLDPMPFLFAQFFAANILSLVLLIGNPTNIIVGVANGLNFISYSKYMVFPALVAAGSCYLAVYLKFRKAISVTCTTPDIDPSTALIDRRGAYFNGAVLLFCLVMLTVAPFAKVSMWVITLIAMIIVLLHNIYYWPWHLPVPLLMPSAHASVSQMSEAKLQHFTEALHPRANSSKAHFDSEDSEDVLTEIGFRSDDPADYDLDPSMSNFAMPQQNCPAFVPGWIRRNTGVRRFPQNVNIPTVWRSLAALPWRIVPFVFGMFVLVEGLNQGGWIDAISDVLVDGIESYSSSKGAGVFTSVFLMTVITIILCNLVNNQPATILLTRVVISDTFNRLSPDSRSSGMLAVIMGSNLGANFTLIGALAGIMFSKILSEKGITLSYSQFIKVGFQISPIVLLCSCLALWIQNAYFF